MKRKTGGKLTPEQTDFREHAARQGYVYQIAYTWQEAARQIVDYLGLKNAAPIRD